ncbi:hypothetical protein D6201_09390 [Aurantiacibacter aquimixticola]|uniref:Uncharacterized protein n=1 Tax=Aurantiacibacter aquimixticola TaxID=1958945 RepID=A0A419RUT5_9SPHN|nr:hypothetical protein D6201_09390 [Aurantiacibacter aquimixticola]
MFRACEVARDRGLVRKVEHLAGQRLDSLHGVIGNHSWPTKQGEAIKNALAQWKAVRERRSFIAHGRMTVSLQQSGEWVALLDLTVFHANLRTDDRWAVTESEATQFLDEIMRASHNLGTQLGQVREAMQNGLRSTTETQ